MSSSEKNYLLTITQPSSSAYFEIVENLVKPLKSENGLLLLGSLIILGVIYFLGNIKSKKGKLAKGRWGKNRELNTAKKQAFKQIEAKKHNEVAVYIGRPSKGIFAPSPIFLPDAQRGIAVIGGPGSGKTRSLIDQALLSVLDQGFPLLVWDFKYPTQSKRLAGYAASLGYDVRIFAPGYPESEICNLLDFLNNESDALMARQFAEVMNRNFKKSNQSVDDAFFSVAGDQLTEAVLMLAKGTEYPDLMMCQALLSMTNLPQRILAKKAEINPWVYTSFGQLISVAQSEKTVASIIATANANFTMFMKADILSAFCGKTTIPLNLEGKKLLILGLDREKRDVLSPLMATILHLIVNRNVVKQRQEPLVLSLDELPTLYLPALVHWLNENREDGLATILGFQNIVQLEKNYGKELSRAILGACATKVIFNPQDGESARLFSEYLGDEEVHFQQKSKGRSGGKASSNISEQERTKKLFEASEILKMPRGKCILISPGFQSKGEAYVPLVRKIRFSPCYLGAISKSEAIWLKIRPKLIQRSGQNKVTREALKKRYELAETLYPLPKNQSEVKNKQTNKIENLDESKFMGMI